jgi:hypothetical protein
MALLPPTGLADHTNAERRVRPRYQDFFAPSVGTAAPITTGLQPRRTVYLFTGALGVDVCFCRVWVGCFS